MSSENWKKAVIKQRGDYSRRLKSAHLINGSGYSSWPTVSANEDSYRINGSSQASKCLSGMAKRGELSWPTASSRDYKGAPQSRLTPEGYNARLDEAVIIYGQAAQANPSTDGSRQGSLNPAWVETLMGLPIGWTDCGSSATESSQPPLNELSAP
jgi:hypothetical protein